MTVFGHDRSGEGDTKDAAVSAAVNDLPGHVARHFAPARHGNPPRKSAKERTLGMFDEPAATEPSARRGTRERTYREPPRGPQLDLPIGGTQVARRGSAREEVRQSCPPPLTPWWTPSDTKTSP